ncbi:PROTEIN putative-RELATED [Salix purpurea]|uniref:PROTEIN putative-RELATED n=1 Tax=Salix purpurea TaxID=77065 RepID=A0A9Q0P0N5_SALPP|nr:PROTEIN putative-RELATED [Salix purpurea]
MRKQRDSGYPVGRLVKSSRRTHKIKGQGKQNFGCHCDANLSRCEERLQGFIFSTSCHAVFAFLNPFLLGVIQVKFQGTSQSAFQTRLPSMWAFLLATFLYCFAFAANMKFKYTTYFRFSGHVAFLAGSFSSISLVSFLLPARLGPLVFAVWAILPIMVARSTVQFICLWIYQRIMTLIFKILGFWYWILDDMSIEEQPEYPVEILVTT